jgi:hypothetical protein
LNPRDPAHILVLAERVIFTLVGSIFFVAAFALAIRGLVDLWPLITGPQHSLIGSATDFLDVMLLVLMIVELAYTVIISLRGSVLTAEPFLLVGLIAVIRRILVVTIGEPGPEAKEAVGATIQMQAFELGVLTAVALVLVLAIVMLRRSPEPPLLLDDSPPHDPPAH